MTGEGNPVCDKVLKLTDWHAYAELSPTLTKTGEGDQSARQKRSMEDDVSEEMQSTGADEMESTGSATESDAQAGDEVMGEDSAAKRTKTADSAGAFHVISEF